MKANMEARKDDTPESKERRARLREAIAYKAYKLSLGGKDAPVIDGMTGDERFFLNYAQSHREKTSKCTVSSARSQVRTRLISCPACPG